MRDETAVAGRNPDVSHERSDVHLIAVAVTVAGTFIGSVIVVLLLWFFFEFLRAQHVSIADVFSLPKRFETVRSNPLLQRSPRHDLEVLKQGEQRVLQGFGWTDRNQGLVHIPIERAIEWIGKQGLPPAESMPDLKLGVPRSGHRQTGFEVYAPRVEGQ